MKKGLIKKIILVTVCIISCLGLTGCGTGLQEFVETDLTVKLRGRADANLTVAAEFYKIGALSEDQYNNIVAQINASTEKLLKDVEGSGTNNQALARLANAVTMMHLGGNGAPSHVVYVNDDGDNVELPWHSGNSHYCEMDVQSDGSIKCGQIVENETGTELTNTDVLTPYIMSNYLYGKELRGVMGKGDIGETVARVNKNTIVPITFVDDDYAEHLNEITSAKLYVLRPDIMETNGISTVDGLMELIQKVKEEDDGGSNSVSIGEAKAEYLNNYFIEASDTNGDPIYIINTDDDADKKKYNVAITSIDRPSSMDITYNEPGYDMNIGQYDLEDCLTVRFKEFNQEAVSNLMELLGGDGRIYLVNSKQGEWRAYLMEYPIESIDTLELTSRTDSWATESGGFPKVEVGLDKSGIGINLMSGQFVKYPHTNNNAINSKFDYTQSTPVDIPSGGVYYLTTSGAQNNDASGLSSLVINGYTTTEVKDTAGKVHTVNCGRIVLRDYLEATYAPNYASDYMSDGTKNMVVFGRKIRFKMDNSNFFEDTTQEVKTPTGTKYNTVLMYERGITVASFVDQYGVEIPSSPTLEITDFCSFNLLQNSDPNSCYVSRLPYKNEEDFDNKREVSSDTPDINELSVRNDMAKIHPVSWFPSPDMGVTDYRADTKQKQRFYCIATTKGMFGSALYSSWVESTVPDANLDWWNEYLADNGFSYKVEHTDIARYLSDNYRYQLSQNGVVILDLETVEKIQEMYDEEADSKRVGAIRTAFIFIGWVLIVGSFLLMLLWVFDTNTDLGFGLLEKVTLGNWVAVKYAEDIPTHNVNDQKYVCFKDICIKTMILIAIGILLIRIDIFYILTVLIDIFGNIASQLEKLIKGRIG